MHTSLKSINSLTSLLLFVTALILSNFFQFYFFKFSKNNSKWLTTPDSSFFFAVLASCSNLSSSPYKLLESNNNNNIIDTTNIHSHNVTLTVYSTQTKLESFSNFEDAKNFVLQTQENIIEEPFYEVDEHGQPIG